MCGRKRGDKRVQVSGAMLLSRSSHRKRDPVIPNQVGARRLVPPTCVDPKNLKSPLRHSPWSAPLSSGARAIIVRTIVAGACAAARGVDARLPRNIFFAIVCTSSHDELERPLLLLLATLLVTTFLFLFASPKPLPEPGTSSPVSIRLSRLALLRPMSSLSNVNRGGFAVPPSPSGGGEEGCLCRSSHATSAILPTNSSKSLLAACMTRLRTAASL